MERELRRYQNLLVCVGTGVISFGIWSLIKGIMTLFRDKEELLDIMKALVGPEYAGTVLYILVFIISAVIAVDLIIRFAIGTAARKDGFGMRKNKHRGYLVLAAILAAFTFGSLLSNFRNISEIGQIGGYVNNAEQVSALIDMILDVGVQTLIDATSIIMLIEMLVAAAKVSHLEKKIREAKAEEGAS